MTNQQLTQIRQAERESHMQVYTEHKLYAQGSWLQKPIKTVLDILSLFEGYEALRVLDLGAGVGRNCIPFAQKYRDIACHIDCVDILELAIAQLEENARTYQVEPFIRGIVSPIEAYPIEENTYDVIMAISALEHVDSKNAFCHKLQEIHNGVRKNGIVCLVVNSEITENDKETGDERQPQFEVNWKTDELQKLLKDTFARWQELKTTVVPQKYDIPRSDGVVELTSNVVTYVARKEGTRNAPSNQ